MRLALLALPLVLLTVPAAAEPDTFGEETACFVSTAARTGHVQAACYDGLVGSCLTMTMQAQTLDSMLANGMGEGCFQYLTEQDMPCSSANCQAACTRLGCVGTYYEYTGTGLTATRETGVYILDSYTAVFIGPHSAYLLYGGGMTHCATGVSANGNVAVHECVY